ncbi:MAG: hypothetical protein L0G81_12515, partial [Ewingella sp.]|nr:hypothetical protein [Ewingella sp.]
MHNQLLWACIMNIFYPVPEPLKLSIPFFQDKVQAGFPSPALFPYKLGCQSLLSGCKSIYFRWLIFRIICNPLLTKLTIVRNFKALNNGRIATHSSHFICTFNGSFVPLVDKKE